MANRQHNYAGDGMGLVGVREFGVDFWVNSNE